MKPSAAGLNRRFFVMKILAGTIIGLSDFPGFIRTVLAMGMHNIKQGVQKIKGYVRINGIPAKIGALVNPGDVVTTGPDSLVVFVMHKSVYLIREDTHVEFSSDTSEQFKESITNVINIFKGKMLSVFGRRQRSMITPTAVIGVRGTGIYVEAEPKRTYICTCYGTVEIEAKASPDIKETITTTHHESPRFVYASGAQRLIVKAPVFNHTDAELIMLESLAFRKPPFVDDSRRTGY